MSSYFLKIPFDTDRVIEEVRNRPMLWDRYNKLYKEKEARDAAWLDIGSELVEDFDSMKETHKLDIVKRIQQRWRTARDTYQKVKTESHNKPVGVRKKGKRKYLYYDSLTFLDSERVPDDDSNSEKHEVSSISSEEGDVISDDLQQQQQQQQQHPQHPATITVQQMLLPLQHATPQPPHKKKKLIHLKTMSISSKPSPSIQTETSIDNPLQLESEDLAFFQSLQPTLMRFTNYQKMLFRTKVLQVIMDINHPVTLVDPIKIEK